MDNRTIVTIIVLSVRLFVNKSGTHIKNENPGQDEMAARKSALKEKIDALEQSILSGNS